MKGFMWREIAYRCFIVFATSLEDKNERECLFQFHLMRLNGWSVMEGVVVSVLRVIVEGVHRAAEDQFSL